MGFKANVSSEGLSRAIAERLRYPGRTESQIINYTAFNVALKAKNNTPFASPEKIDTSLKVSASYITKTGKFSKRRRISYGGGDKHTDVPLAALILNARANPNSKYNQLSSGRYAGASPFKGLSRAAGAQAMRDAVRKLIKMRRKSSKFILSGWLPAIKQMARFVKGGRAMITDKDAQSGEDRGDATPAIEGSTRVQAEIENTTGEEGVNAVNANKALNVYGGPALQQAIDSEEKEMISYMMAQTKPRDDKFNAMCR